MGSSCHLERSERREMGVQEEGTVVFHWSVLGGLGLADEVAILRKASWEGTFVLWI